MLLSPRYTMLCWPTCMCMCVCVRLHAVHPYTVRSEQGSERWLWKKGGTDGGLASGWSRKEEKEKKRTSAVNRSVVVVVGGSIGERVCVGGVINSAWAFPPLFF